MKNLIFIGLILFLSCQGNQEVTEENIETNLVEHEFVNDKKNKATNHVDRDGYRQGKWIVDGKAWPEKGYPADGKIEEGNFQDDKKVDQWLYYDIDGITVKQKSNYTDGALNGITLNYDYENKTVTEIVYDMDRVLSVTSRPIEE